MSSAIFQSENVEVGVVIGDDDSSILAACRAASTRPIIKQSDVTHASGGVKTIVRSGKKSPGVNEIQYCTCIPT